MHDIFNVGLLFSFIKEGHKRRFLVRELIFMNLEFCKKYDQVNNFGPGPK